MNLKSLDKQLRLFKVKWEMVHFALFSHAPLLLYLSKCKTSQFFLLAQSGKSSQ